MPIIPLDIGFKGSRTYLHSTDVYQGVAAALGRAAPDTAVGPLSLRFRHFARNACDLYLNEPVPEDLAARVAIDGRWGDGDAACTVRLVETERPVTARCPSFEPAVMEASRIDGNLARLEREPGLPPIEAVVFLAKKLYIARVPDGAARPVVVCRLDLARPLCDDDASLSVTLLGNNATSLAEFDVASDGHSIGKIFLIQTSH